jgi:putative FmdB family regulatory protein
MSPVYVYRCAKCGASKEMLQPITAYRLELCECGFWMIRTYSAPAVVYKGDGFAKKDRKKEAKG